jgi:hypothetical protein
MTANGIIYTSRLLHFIMRHHNFSFCFEPSVQLGQGDQRSRARCPPGLKPQENSLALIRDAVALDRHFEAIGTPHDNFDGKTNLNRRCSALSTRLCFL